MDNIAERIADKVKTAGGRTFYVGGFVRDRLLGIDNKDTDIEVHGITPDKLMGILGEIGEPLCFGQSFGIYSLRGESIDIAMPRRERKSGTGHRDFDVDVDPFIGTFEAARRREGLQRGGEKWAAGIPDRSRGEIDDQTLICKNVVFV